MWPAVAYKWVVLSNNNERDGGSLAEADGQRNRAFVALAEEVAAEFKERAPHFRHFPLPKQVPLASDYAIA